MLPLRGREPELRAIAQRIGLLGQGHGGCLLIEGPPGIGKTRLLAELARLAQSRNLLVARAACDELDRYAPMLPLLSALRSGPDPILARGELDLAATDIDRRFWFLERVRDIVERRARQTPFVIILDDLQWADAATLVALRTLCPPPDSSAVLWVLAYNPGQSPAGLDRVLDRLRAHGAEILPLTPLVLDDALQLATDLLGHPLTAKVRDLVGGAGGNPLLIAERAGMPSAFRRHVRRRLREVSPDVRQLLEVGAVLGPSFALDDAASMLARPPGLMLGTVAAALGTGLILTRQDTLAFGHDLIHQAVYDELPEAVRAGLHREAARLTSGAGRPAGEVTEHLDRALRHLDCGQFVDAAREAETGQRIAGESGLARPAAAALGILGQVAFHRGDLAAAEDYARAAELAAGGLTADPAARWVRVLLADAEGCSDDALDLSFETGADTGQDRVAMLSGIGVSAIPYAARIALRAGRADDCRGLAAGARRLAVANPEVVIAAGIAAHAEGIARCDADALGRAVAVYQETGYALAAVMAGEDLGRALLHGRDHAAAIEHLRVALATAAEIGAVRHADRIRRVLRQAGVRHRFSSPRRPVTFGWDSLTDAELRVASLAAEGLTNQAIADRLFLSPHTVNTHLRHVFSKLGVNSRLGLVRFVLTETPSAAAS